MGLDSYWVKVVAPGQTAEPVLFDPPLQLCGGMFSGGNSSFRGKVYAEMIEAISDISLYQELMPNDQVHAIADALGAVIANPEDWPDWANHPDLKDLRWMFGEYAKHNYLLAGWW